MDAETETPTHILNLYAPWEKGSEYVLDSIAQTWTNIELDFTPFYLCHTKILEDGEKGIVFLLTGSDKQIHLYREETGIRFSEHPVGSLFPEFQDLPCVALWLDCRNLADNRRLSVVGCRNGYIRLSLVNINNKEILQQWEAHHDSAITCARIFTSSTHVESSSSWLHRRDHGICSDNDDEEDYDPVPDSDYSLLVTSALEVAVVYRNVVKGGFRHQMTLPQSDQYDCALCTCVADLDWDGRNELLIGTYGQELLVYKYHQNNGQRDQEAHGSSPTDPESSSGAEGIPDDVISFTASGGEGADWKAQGRYELMWTRSFGTPLLALTHFDLTGDGLREIIVLSTRGLHVLQHNLEKAAQRCLEGLKQLVAQEPT